RIAIVLPDLRVGGAELLHVNLAKDWLRRDVQVDFVLRATCGDLIKEIPSNSRVIGLEVGRVKDMIFPLKNYLLRESTDTILAAMWPLTVIAPLAARMAGFRGRVAVSEHSPLSIAYRNKGKAHDAALR